MHKPASVRENDTHKHLWDFGLKTDHLISVWRPDLIEINKNKKQRKKKREHRIKWKEKEKKDNYLDLNMELKNLWNTKVTIIPIVIDAFGTIT